MKILYWTPLFWPEIGGIEVVAQTMATGLNERGHRLLVLASHGSSNQPDTIIHAGVPVHRFHFWQALSRRDPGLIASIRRQTAALIEEFQPDIVHSNFSGYTAYFQLAAATAYKAPLLVALHSSLKGMRAGADTILGSLLRSADWVTTDSQSTLDDACAIAGEIGGRSSVIYNGRTPGASDPEPLPWDEPRLMAIGRLVAEKGFDLAISALKLLRADFPRLTLHLVGAGPERSTLQKQACDLGLGDAVEFIGKAPDRMIAGLLNRATIVLIPSRCQESFPLVAVEAALMGRPVIAAAAGGLREIVREKKTGLLVEMNNPAALAAAVSRLLADRRLAVAMGRYARKMALRTFTADKMITVYEALYQRLIHAEPHRYHGETRT